MRSIISIILLLIQLALAQEAAAKEGDLLYFFGLKVGDSREMVITELLKIKGIIFLAEMAKENTLLFDNAPVPGGGTKSLLFLFTNNMCKGCVSFTREVRSEPTVTNLSQFMGIQWGQSMSEALTIIKKYPGISIDEKRSTKDIIFVQGLNYFGREALFTTFLFNSDRFSRGMLLFMSEASGLWSDYENLVGQVSRAYGPSTDNYESYTFPYEKGDGRFIAAVRNDKTKIGTIWGFPKTASKEEIIVEIVSMIGVVVVFQNCALQKAN